MSTQPLCNAAPNKKRCLATSAPWRHHHWPTMAWCEAHKPDGARMVRVILGGRAAAPSEAAQGEQPKDGAA